MFKIANGSCVQDTVTGFSGTVIGRVEYLTGCVQYLVKPKIGGDGKMPDGHWIDEIQLVEVANPVPGGPALDAPRNNSRTLKT